MPKGFGYGAVGKAFNAVKGFAGRYATEAAVVGAPGAGAARYFSGMSNISLSAVAGGAMGGMYGAMSEDTSVLGGIAMGAGLGAGGLYSFGRGARYANSYAAGRARGISRSGSFSIANHATYNAMAKDSAALIANTQRRVINPIRSTLKGFMGR